MDPVPHWNLRPNRPLPNPAADGTIASVKPFSPSRLRAAAIRRAESWLREHDLPRLQMSFIMALTGLAALFFSYLMLRAGLDSMGLRYPLSVALAYGVFLVLLRIWIWIQTQRTVTREAALDSADALDLLDGVTHHHSIGPLLSQDSDRSFLDGDLDGWDLGDAVFLGLAALAALAGSVACLVVIWSAPALLAEILVDTLIMAGVYHRLKVTGRRTWLTGALKRTWIPALSLMLCLGLAGWALQQVIPEAHSIGPVVRHLASRDSR